MKETQIDHVVTFNKKNYCKKLKNLNCIDFDFKKDYSVHIPVYNKHINLLKLNFHIWVFVT